MRVLVVTDNRFWRGQIGSQRRILSLCKHLHDQGHELSIVFAGHLYPVDQETLDSGRFPYAFDSFGLRAQPSDAVGREAPLIIRFRWGLRQIISQLASQLSRWRREKTRPSGKRVFFLQLWEPKLRDFVDQRVKQRFQSACEKFRPQLIIVEYVRLAYVLSDCRSAIPHGCRTIIDTHDVQYERQARFHETGERHDIDITPAEEADALSLADAVLAIQSIDGAKLSEILPNRKVLVAGFPESLYEHPRRANADNVVRLAFFGSDMPPNREAALVMLRHFFPLLRARFGKQVELHIFGKVCNAFEPDSGNPGVIFHGYVDDLVAAYEQIDLVTNPVRFGGGLKIKNVEALCHGRALITTPVGAEGLEAAVGKGFWVAADDTQFAAMLEKLVEDTSLRTQLAQDALAFARDNLSEEVVYAALDSYIKS